eukprot:1157842-Pelagomonas_calceolata.AAC.7
MSDMGSRKSMKRGQSDGVKGRFAWHGYQQVPGRLASHSLQYGSRQKGKALWQQQMDKGVELAAHLKEHTLLVRMYKHLKLENHITDEPTERPLPVESKASNIPEMHWHNICKRGRYKLDSLAGRHFRHSKG